MAITLICHAEFDPAATPLSQDRLDGFGVWNAQSSNPLNPCTFAADIATLATTLFGETLCYLEEFSRFIIRNNALVMITTQRTIPARCQARCPTSFSIGKCWDGLSSADLHIANRPRPIGWFGAVKQNVQPDLSRAGTSITPFEAARIIGDGSGEGPRHNWPLSAQNYFRSGAEGAG
ncbi:hypothetical protein MINTM001_00890 [Mycobacterium paraintracellulare]|uniref:hypothetical protein n=1 Tax=Mycobacterium paraintracellulare TaxID=1138383 RepID=UPI001934EDED|nr:hypothetical protein [Mycobacterium paraintracellulare]BCO38950.1 hypothetical protein MINTM001_00890 [Mycobacterium paraintracellulare]